MPLPRLPRPPRRPVRTALRFLVWLVRETIAVWLDLDRPKPFESRPRPAREINRRARER
ncbi:hypothetical protein [Umezawaea sp.]|uniref:hypothetical protein n=1 Tax=Umezawaea sp. TaxID=1955258 RepID=UPI002ED3B71D